MKFTWVTEIFDIERDKESVKIRCKNLWGEHVEWSRLSVTFGLENIDWPSTKRQDLLVIQGRLIATKKWQYRKQTEGFNISFSLGDDDRYSVGFVIESTRSLDRENFPLKETQEFVNNLFRSVPVKSPS